MDRKKLSENLEFIFGVLGLVNFVYGVIRGLWNLTDWDTLNYIDFIIQSLRIDLFVSIVIVFPLVIYLLGLFTFKKLEFKETIDFIFKSLTYFIYACGVWFISYGVIVGIVRLFIIIVMS